MDNLMNSELSVLGVTWVFVLFSVAFSLRRLAEENGDHAVFTGYGTGTRTMVAGVKLGAPICRLSLYENFVVVGIGWPFLVRYTEISSIKYDRGFLFESITINLAASIHRKCRLTLSKSAVRRILKMIHEKHVRIVSSRGLCWENFRI
jgi:hypothetical protein